MKVGDMISLETTFTNQMALKRELFMSEEKIFKCSTAYNYSYYGYGGYTTSAISVDTEKYILFEPEDIDNVVLDDPPRYSVYDIANWFLLKQEMTHKKLQKLCYYSQA